MTDPLSHEIERALEKITPGPWQVVEDYYEEHVVDGKQRGPVGKVAQRRIFTTWDHPQLKGPLGVVNGFVTIAKVMGQSPYHGVSMTAEDAEFIAQAPDLLRRAVDALRQQGEQIEHARALVQNWRQDAPAQSIRHRMMNACANELEAVLPSSGSEGER